MDTPERDAGGGVDTRPPRREPDRRNADRPAPAAGVINLEGRPFRPEDLAADRRPPGISAFMRIKNGADFLEATIRSHIGEVDEIVAVYNQCTDETPAILMRLQREFGAERLRVCHYLPKVFAPGSDGHAATPADAPASFVNMSNAALAATRFRVVMKLDDDHVAMPQRLAAVTRRIRQDGHRLDRFLCFSGLNLARDETGAEGVLASEPFSGNGDIGFFELTPRTHFIHDRRFETFAREKRARAFADFTYWHMRYLKRGFGFANRDIEAGNARFARKRDRFLADRRVISVAELKNLAPRSLPLLLRLPIPEKPRLKAERWDRLLRHGPTDAELHAQFS